MPSLNDSLSQDLSPAAPAAARKFTPRALGVVALCAVSIAAMLFVIVRSYRGYSASADVQSRYRTLIDSETGQVFEDFKVQMNDTVPIANPATGKRTLYPAETCYWTRDGGAKLTPTWVLLNEVVKKPGPTKCPDCGRTVVVHNPMPPLELLQQAAEREKK